MIDNTIADHHLLTTTDHMFFEYKILEINERIERIKQDNNLEGYWTISEDHTWLVKIGD